jgi:hypothetical protein
VLFLPYVDGLYQKLKSLLRKRFGLDVLALRRTNLDDLLVHRRPAREVFDKSEVVYLIPCADCNGKYIGQTGRILGKRLKEHELQVKSRTTVAKLRRNKGDCGVAIHCKQFGHHMRFEDTQVLAEERHELKRRLLESMFIEEYKQRDDCFLLNVKAGDEIPEIWKGMLRKEK